MHYYLEGENIFLTQRKSKKEAQEQSENISEFENEIKNDEYQPQSNVSLNSSDSVILIIIPGCLARASQTESVNISFKFKF